MIFYSKHLTKLCGNIIRYPFSVMNSQQMVTAMSKSYTVQTVVKELEKLAPKSLAESWDNVGLLVEPSEQEAVERILLTNDLTENVMDEAVDRHVQLIVSYHPPIFSPLKKITQSSWKERIVARCLENKIGIYSPHTCYDALHGGVNDWLSKAFDCASVMPIHPSYVSSGPTRKVAFRFHNDKPELLKDLKELANKLQCQIITELQQKDNMHIVSITCSESAVIKFLSVGTAGASNVEVTKLEKLPLLGNGMGRICQLQKSLSVKDVIQSVKTHLDIPDVLCALGVHHSLDTQIKTVALCAGSGASVLRGVHADVYLTGEMSHHEVLDAIHNETSVILCRHSNTERGYLSVLSKMLESLFEGNLEIFVSSVDKDPLVTY